MTKLENYLIYHTFIGETNSKNRISVIHYKFSNANALFA